MKSFWGPIMAMVWKDSLIEWRSREILLGLVMFALLMVVVFNFALDPGSQREEGIRAGILWSTFSFAGVLGMARVFVLEKDQGSLEALILSPVSRDVIYFGKFLSFLLFMIIADLIVVIVFSVMFNMPLLLPILWLIVIMASIGFASVGTLFSAISVNTRFRDVMLPLLFVPVSIPVLIAAIEATTQAIGGLTTVGIGRWLQILGVFDVVFLIASALTFQFVLED